MSLPELEYRLLTCHISIERGDLGVALHESYAHGSFIVHGCYHLERLLGVDVVAIPRSVRILKISRCLWPANPCEAAVPIAIAGAVRASLFCVDRGLHCPVVGLQEVELRARL